MTQIGTRNASIDSRRARRLPLFNMAECAILPVGIYRRVTERPLLANSEIRAGLLLLGATGSNGALAPLNDHFPPVCSDFRFWPKPAAAPAVPAAIRHTSLSLLLGHLRCGVSPFVYPCGKGSTGARPIYPFSLRR